MRGTLLWGPYNRDPSLAAWLWAGRMFPGFEGFRRFFGLYGFGGLEVYF